MGKKKYDFDLDSYDDDFDDIFDDKGTEVETSFSSEDTMDYEEFNNTNGNYEEYEEYEDDEDSVSSEESNDLNPALSTFLSTFSVWFLRIGVGIMIVLMAVFITNGNFIGLFKYLLLLVVAFFGGYFFMFFLDKYKENN